MNPPSSPGGSLRTERDSTAFSSFSTSSNSRTTTGWRLNTDTSRAAFTPELDAPTSRLPDVSGRSDLANHVIAEQLKTLLDTDDHPPPPASSPSDDIKPDISTPNGALSRPLAAGGINSRLLAEAFRREYSATANDERKRAYSTMYTEEEEDASSRFSRAPSYAGSMMTQSDRGVMGEGRKKFRSGSQQPQALILPGLGEGKQRGLNGKSLFGGQDVGAGVIGSQAFLMATTEDGGESVMVIEGCDILMPAAGCDWKVKQIEGEEEGMKFMVGPHIVSLEEDLPPLAAEHPARVWNSILHSLPQALVPIVQWKYEKVGIDDDDDREPMHVCRLTLSLSPLHPAISAHPSFPQLPVNQHTSEYVTATAAIGGSKTWTGEPKVLKTDATNSALIKAISSGAFEWLHNKSLDDSVHQLSTRQLSESPVLSLPTLSGEPAHPPTSPVSEGTANDALEPRWDVVPFVNRAVQPSDNTSVKARAENLQIADVAPEAERVDMSFAIKQTIQKFLSGLPASAVPTFCLTVEWDHKAKAFVERLKVGIESHNLSFGANAIPDAHFAATVIGAALERDLEAFMRLVGDSFASTSSRQGQLEPGVHSVSAMASFSDDDKLVDWVEQLKVFCRSNSLRFPTHTQTIERLAEGEGVRFRAALKLEEEAFQADSAYDTILQARQEMARWVYCQHFGQTAVPLDHQSGDGGYKGGRGGRGSGKRGRGRW